jgi:hypothetical protein
MNWIDLLGQNKFLASVFPSPPSLTAVRIPTIEFHQDGPRASVSFHLNDFPKELPRSWKGSGANRVIITLMCVGIRDSELRGWGKNNIGDVAIKRRDDAMLSLDVLSPSFQLGIVCDAIVVENVSAHIG